MLHSKSSKIAAHIIVLALIVVGSLFIYNRKSEEEASIKTISVTASIAGYSNLTDMENASDIIIIANPKEEFINRESVATHFSDGEIQDFYSFVDLNIEKIIKNESTLNLEKDKTMQVIEPVAIMDRDNKKTKLTIENYVEMQAGTSYLLFIVQTLPGIYSIVNFDNGRFIVNESEVRSKGMKDNSSDFHKKLKNDAFQKYGLH